MNDDRLVNPLFGVKHFFTEESANAEQDRDVRIFPHEAPQRLASNCAHFVLNSTSLHPTQAYSSQHSLNPWLFAIVTQY